MSEHYVGIVNSENISYIDFLKATEEDTDLFGLQDELEDNSFARINYREFENTVDENRDELSSGLSDFYLDNAVEDLIYRFPAVIEPYMPESSREIINDYIGEYGKMPMPTEEPESQKYFENLGDLLAEDLSDQNELDRFDYEQLENDLEAIWINDIDKIDHRTILKSSSVPDSIRFLSNINDFWKIDE